MITVVVRIQGQPGTSPWIELESGPEPQMQNADRRPFSLTIDRLNSWPDPTPVRNYGQALLAVLLNSGDQSLRDAITAVVNAGGTLNFVVEDAMCAQQSWEALFTSSFLALGSNWSIGRLVEPRPDPKYDPTPIESPLRVMAILGARQISAVDDWEKLFEAAQGAAQQGLTIRLNVLAAESSLLDDIAGLGGSPADNLTLSVSAMPSRKNDVVDKINEFMPHFLHFFCHGRSEANVRSLLLTDQNHWGTESTITLDIDTLTESLGVKGAWMVVVNACRGGAGTELLYSLTHQLVRRGVPAAVGMMEEIDAVYAKVFCKSFYRAAFREILRVIKVLDGKPEGEGEEIEWTKVLRGPRSSLSQEYVPPDQKREWTLPVLYVRRHGFRVRRAARPVDHSVISGFLALFPEDRRGDVRTFLSET